MATKEERNDFSLSIEKIVEELDLSYIDAITHHCEETGLEIELAASLVNDTLKSKLECEAQQLRYLPRSAALPI
jgi:Phage late-transcription coactivator